MREIDKHMQFVQQIGLVLESKKIGEELSVTQIAKEAKMHSQTARKALERLYYSQNFMPRIDLEYGEKSEIKVTVIDFPMFFTECTELERLILVKLFNLGGYVNNKVDWEVRSKEELRVILDQEHLISIDSNNRRATLTMEGVKRALDTMKFLAWIRDSAIRDLEETSKMLRDMKYPVYPSPHPWSV